MPEHKFEAKPLTEVNRGLFSEAIAQLSVDGKVKGPDMVRYVYSLSDVIGPLTVRERWDLLGDYNLEPLRRHVNLVGSANAAALDVVEEAFRRLYPTTAYVMKLINDNADPSPMTPEMKDLLNVLFIETSTDS